MIFTRQAGNRWQGAEAPEIIYRDGYYYLFLAYDGLDVPYNTRVVRSEHVDGPYLGIDGTDVSRFGGDAFPIVTHPYKFGTDPGWVGISHCAIFDDGEGNWFYASQAECRYARSCAQHPLDFYGLACGDARALWCYTAGTDYGGRHCRYMGSHRPRV